MTVSLDGNGVGLGGFAAQPYQKKSGNCHPERSEGSLMKTVIPKRSEESVIGKRSEESQNWNLSF